MKRLVRSDCGHFDDWEGSDKFKHPCSLCEFKKDQNIRDEVKAVKATMWNRKHLEPTFRDELDEPISRILDRLERYEKALNKVAMLGCSEHAYTKEFTERVNTIVRKALEEK